MKKKDFEGHGLDHPEFIHFSDFTVKLYSIENLYIHNIADYSKLRSKIV